MKGAQVAAELLVPADPLVVVDEVATTVQDEATASQLHGADVVRRVPDHHVDPSVDEAVGEGALLPRDLVAPVRAPMDRHHPDVTGAARGEQALGDPVGCHAVQVVHDGDSRSRAPSPPVARHSARGVADAEDDEVDAGLRRTGRRPVTRRALVATGSSCLEAGRAERARVSRSPRCPWSRTWLFASPHACTPATPSTARFAGDMRYSTALPRSRSSDRVTLVSRFMSRTADGVLVHHRQHVAPRVSRTDGTRDRTTHPLAKAT